MYEGTPRALMAINFSSFVQTLCCPPVSCGKGWTPYDRDCWRILSNVNNSHYSNISTCRYLTHNSASKPVLSLKSYQQNFPAPPKFSPLCFAPGPSASPLEASWPVSTTRLRMILSPGCCCPGQRRGLSAFRPPGWGPGWGTVASGAGWMALAGTGRPGTARPPWTGKPGTARPPWTGKPGTARPPTGLQITVWWWGCVGGSDWQSGATLLVTILSTQGTVSVRKLFLREDHLTV